MSLVIPDIQLIALIKADPRKTVPKTTHRWPAGVNPHTGYLRQPKMQERTEHKVYERAPYGSYGNPHEPPLLVVYIEEIWDSKPHEWCDEEMIHEGFTDIEAYGIWWDQWKAGVEKGCKPWVETQGESFWCCRFHLTRTLPYYNARLQVWAQELGIPFET